MSQHRVETFKALAQLLGIEGLANVEAHLVRSRPVPPRLLARLASDEDTKLSPREREVMVLLVSGYRRKEIAAELGVTDETVKTHLHSAYAKFGVHTQIDAINAFLEEAA